MLLNYHIQFRFIPSKQQTFWFKPIIDWKEIAEDGWVEMKKKRKKLKIPFKLPGQSWSVAREDGWVVMEKIDGGNKTLVIFTLGGGIEREKEEGSEILEAILSFG